MQLQGCRVSDVPLVQELRNSIFAAASDPRTL